MGPTEFAVACREEKDALLSAFTDLSSVTTVANHLAAANLTPPQRQHVIAAIDAALTDAFYTLLLALDGAAALGGIQKPLVINDGERNTIANGDGTLEAAAFDVFYGN